MKRISLTLLIIMLIIIGTFFCYKYINNQENHNDNPIKMDSIKPNLDTEKNEYEDTNPIKIGLYKYYGSYKNRELITEYTTTWNYYNDISSFEVFFTQEETITGSYFKDTFQTYYNNYQNIDNYRIGYKISFITNNEEINKTILSPKDTEEFFEYLEIYLYDDYHREKGVWYSHTTENDYTNETLLTSIKLTTGKLVNEIISDITVTAFTYTNNDFDEFGNYRGNSKYTIIVKNPN